MDWGLSGVIVGFIAFISNMFTDARVKRLNNQLADVEKRLATLEKRYVVFKCTSDIEEEEAHDRGSDN